MHPAQQRFYAIAWPSSVAGVLYISRLALRVQVLVKLDKDDSKKETGFVGLEYQGAFCFMDSLLQTLYNINHFRQERPSCPSTLLRARMVSSPPACLFFYAQQQPASIRHVQSDGQHVAFRQQLAARRQTSVAGSSVGLPPCDQQSLRCGYPKQLVDMGLQAVYQMPTTEEEQPSQSLPLAPQALFYKVGGGLVLCFCGLLHCAGADQCVCRKTAGADFWCG